MAAVSALPEAVQTRCAGHSELYTYAGLPGRSWAERRLVAMRLCHGCPLLGAPCARLAMESLDPGHMVWSGVPVPPKSRDGWADRNRALAMLAEMAGHE